MLGAGRGGGAAATRPAALRSSGAAPGGGPSSSSIRVSIVGPGSIAPRGSGPAGPGATSATTFGGSGAEGRVVRSGARVESIAAARPSRRLHRRSLARHRRRRCRRRRGQAGRPAAPAGRFLEAELDVLLELPQLVLELPVLELQLLDMAGHLPDLVLEPVHAHDEVGGILRGGGTGQRKAGDEEGKRKEAGRHRPIR